MSTRPDRDQAAYATTHQGAQPDRDSQLPAPSPAIAQEQYELPEDPVVMAARLDPAKLTYEEHLSLGDTAMSDAQVALAHQQYDQMAAFSNYAAAHYAAATAKKQRRWV